MWRGAASCGGDAERPIQCLTAHLDTLHVSQREREVLTQLVELARVTLRLDHRLNHIQDEANLGEPLSSWGELRRVALTTALVWFELDRLRAR